MAAFDIDPGEVRSGAPDAGRDATPASRHSAMSLATAFTAAFAVGGWKIGLQRLHDNSFLVHLTTGRWILDHGIPRHDVYSFTAPGVRFVAQSWLAELVYGLLERSVGAVGIRIVMGVCATVVMVALYRLALHGT